MTSAQTPDLQQLSAWLDAELEPAEQARIDAWLREHPEQAALTRLWAADRDALRARLEPVLDEPVPAALLQTVAHGGRDTGAANQPRRRRAAVAAGLVLGGTLAGQAPEPAGAAL